MRYLTNRFEELGEDLRDSLERRPTGEIEQLVRQVLPPDDSSLQWSEAGGGFTENAEETLRNLYSRLVEKYVRDSELPSRTDDEIARPFKATLERKHVTQRIRRKRIEARDYQYDFEFGWQNRPVWHVYEPVSFRSDRPWKHRGESEHQMAWPCATHSKPHRKSSRFTSCSASRSSQTP